MYIMNFAFMFELFFWAFGLSSNSKCRIFDSFNYEKLHFKFPTK